MKHIPKELIVFDLDGTLAPSKQPMTPSMAKLISKLLHQTKVAVISGGGYPQFQTQFLTSLPSDTRHFSNLYLLPTSGTRLYYWQGQWMQKYAEDLTPEEKKRIIGTLETAMRKAGFKPGAKTHGEIIEDRDSQITFSALGQKAPLDLKEKWDPDHAKRKKIVSNMKDELPEFDIRIGGLTSIDITRRGVNKAYGIHKLEHFLKIPLNKILFVGDALFYGGNDYPAKSTGVDCVQVSGPEECEKLISSWLDSGR